MIDPRPFSVGCRSFVNSTLHHLVTMHGIKAARLFAKLNRLTIRLYRCSREYPIDSCFPPVFAKRSQTKKKFPKYKQLTNRTNSESSSSQFHPTIHLPQSMSTSFMTEAMS